MQITGAATTAPADPQQRTQPAGRIRLDIRIGAGSAVDPPAPVRFPDEPQGASTATQLPCAQPASAQRQGGQPEAHPAGERAAQPQPARQRQAPQRPACGHEPRTPEPKLYVGTAGRRARPSRGRQGSHGRTGSQRSQDRAIPETGQRAPFHPEWRERNAPRAIPSGPGRAPSCHAGSASLRGRAAQRSMLALEHEALDVGDGARRIEVLRAGLGAVHDRVAAIQPERIVEGIEPLAGGLIA